VARLAARFGAHVDPVEVEAIPVRTLPEIAVENAVEGCVRETYGAAVAAFQGEWAQDGAIRRTMRAIAVDEAEHASLGWAIDSWVHPRLGAHERARVDLARHDAREGLVAQACAPVSPELSSIAGVPGTAASEQLIAALAPLWS
jgi:hypothetical protein